MGCNAAISCGIIYKENKERGREERWIRELGLLILVFLETLLTFHDMFILRSALSDFALPFYSFVAPFLFLCSILTSVSKKSLVIPKLYQAAPPPPFFYITMEVSSVRRRFGDESDGIILIPALPLSCSNSLTKLSDPILTPTARVNLLCHLQSTRGSAMSFPIPYQNPPTVREHSSVFSQLLSLFAVCLSAYIYCPFSLFTFLLSVSIV